MSVQLVQRRIQDGNIRLNRRLSKPSLGRTLAHTFKVTLRGFDIALKYTDLIALPVQLKYAFFLQFHSFQQFFFLLFPHLIGSANDCYESAESRWPTCF